MSGLQRRVAQLWWGTGPQLDGLGHLGEDNVYYNCNEGKDFAALTGLTKLGIEKVPPLVGRGVLIPPPRPRASRSARATWCCSTPAGPTPGWSRTRRPGSRASPASTTAAVYLASRNVMAVGADTWGLEAVPAAKGDKVFYGHVTFLKEHGIYILETMNTGRLAKEGVTVAMW